MTDLLNEGRVSQAQDVALPESMAKTLRAIFAFTEAAGYPPTVKDLVEMRELSSPTINAQLLQLQVRGFVKQHTSTARSIVPIKDVYGTPVRWGFIEVAA